MKKCLENFSKKGFSEKSDIDYFDVAFFDISRLLENVFGT